MMTEREKEVPTTADDNSDDNDDDGRWKGCSLSFFHVVDILCLAFSALLGPSLALPDTSVGVARDVAEHWAREKEKERSA